MDAQFFWNMFIETGAPEMYLLYNQVRRTEETHVSESPWTGTSFN